jgi:uncharacterized DUF497 family protein
MDLTRVAGFDWDDGNWPKCGKHGVSRDDIEAMFVNGPGIFAHPDHSDSEQKLRAIGFNDAGRMVYVSFTLREKPEGLLIRPVSARFMHKKEMKRYERDQT